MPESYAARLEPADPDGSSQIACAVKETRWETIGGATKLGVKARECMKQ
jgi:hypothetical protein